MRMNGKEKENVGAKKEVDMNKHPRISTRQWTSCFKNPRIVRVSRTFGGKDRHSKVCTIRGLRDRRIRLSVPTAIQLYDLQDRLGLSQPSKVVDWLIDVTKQEIEKLPPLPMIPTSFTTLSTESLEHQEAAAAMVERSKWISSHDNQESNEGFGGFVQNFFPLNTQFSAPYNSSNFFHWEPPNLSLSQFGGGYAFATHEQNHSLSSGSDQMYLSPSATAMPSAITTHHPMENIDHLRQINHDHHLQNLQQTSSLFPTTLHLINSPMKSSSLSVNSKDVFSLENGEGKQEKDKRSY